MAEGFAKLLMNNLIHSPKILTELMILYNNPLLEKDDSCYSTLTLQVSDKGKMFVIIFKIRTLAIKVLTVLFAWI